MLSVSLLVDTPYYVDINIYNLVNQVSTANYVSVNKFPIPC